MISTGNSFQHVGTANCCDPEVCIDAPLSGTKWEVEFRDCNTGEVLNSSSGGKGLNQCYSSGQVGGGDPIEEPPKGACCVHDDIGISDCSQLTQAECENQCVVSQNLGGPTPGIGEDSGNYLLGDIYPGMQQSGSCVWTEGATCDEVCIEVTTTTTSTTPAPAACPKIVCGPIYWAAGTADCPESANEYVCYEAICSDDD